MEIICTLFAIGFVVMIGYYIMKESDEDRREKEKAQAYIARMQVIQARAAAQEYERQRVPSRSAPITTGRPANSGSTSVKTEVKRHDNLFDNLVDSGSTPTYHSSHKSCSGGGSSGNDSNSSNDSSSASCD